MLPELNNMIKDEKTRGNPIDFLKTSLMFYTGLFDYSRELSYLILHSLAAGYKAAFLEKNYLNSLCGKSKNISKSLTPLNSPYSSDNEDASDDDALPTPQTPHVTPYIKHFK